MGVRQLRSEWAAAEAVCAELNARHWHELRLRWAPADYENAADVLRERPETYVVETSEDRGVSWRPVATVADKKIEILG